MRHVLAVIGVLVASASVAAAREAPPAWTAARASLRLPEVALITMPEDLRVPLQAELDALLAKFRLLELRAQQERDDWLAAGTYANYVRRLAAARQRVRNGLSIDSARCAGTGKAFTGERYRNFRCDATSYVLEVPTVELREGTDGALPAVVEGPTRRFGPYKAVFTLRVTGAAKCVHQRVS